MVASRNVRGFLTLEKLLTAGCPLLFVLSAPQVTPNVDENVSFKLYPLKAVSCVSVSSSLKITLFLDSIVFRKHLKRTCRQKAAPRNPSKFNGLMYQIYIISVI